MRLRNGLHCWGVSGALPTPPGPTPPKPNIKENECIDVHLSLFSLRLAICQSLPKTNLSFLTIIVLETDKRNTFLLFLARCLLWNGFKGESFSQLLSKSEKKLQYLGLAAGSRLHHQHHILGLHYLQEKKARSLVLHYCPYVLFWCIYTLLKYWNLILCSYIIKVKKSLLLVTLLFRPLKYFFYHPSNECMLYGLASNAISLTSNHFSLQPNHDHQCWQKLSRILTVLWWSSVNGGDLLMPQNIPCVHLTSIKYFSMLK